jgi:ATP-binding cassette subfamily B multidrug efflux pump
MQTALAVRDTLFVLADVLVAMAVYVATIWCWRARLTCGWWRPSSSGWGCTSRRCFILCRVGHIGKQQADARSPMTGRITDAYTNINTVKLFSHPPGSGVCALGDGVHENRAHAMRLVSAFEIVNHALSMSDSGHGGHVAVALELGPGGRGRGGRRHRHGAAAAGMSHWIMWKPPACLQCGHGAGRHQHLSRPRPSWTTAARHPGGAAR